MNGNLLKYSNRIGNGKYAPRCAEKNHYMFKKKQFSVNAQTLICYILYLIATKLPESILMNKSRLTVLANEQNTHS